MLINLGEVRNEGVKMQAVWNDRVNEDFSHYIDGSLAWLKNRTAGIGIYNKKGDPDIWVGNVYGYDDSRSLTNLFQTTQRQALNSFHLIRTDSIF